MIKRVLSFGILIILGIQISCSKNKFETGWYVIEFNGSYVRNEITYDWNPKGHLSLIQETEEYLCFDMYYDDTLQKDKRQISGTLNYLTWATTEPIVLKGTRHFASNDIEGTFVTTLVFADESEDSLEFVPVEGSFNMTSGL